MKKSISHFAAIFPCHDPDEIANWYRDKLGFTIGFRWEEPASYVVTHKDGNVSIHFSKTEKKDLQPNLLYIFCNDVDVVYSELKENGVEHIPKPEDQDYGMRDFEVVDPWGNRLTFGKGEE
jgi:uncharacterized glyoxalase superfamily protein PhnB